MPEARRRLMAQLEYALLSGGGTHDFSADVLPMLLDGRAQWWQHGEGVAVTEIRRHPKLLELNCWLVAGRMRDCIALQPEIEDWARRQGVARVVGIGRPGWERVSRAMGFSPVGVALRRDLAP
jgi:hypothetical protein